MRVIRRGKKPSEQLMRGTCQTCHTEVECKKGEASPDSDPREPASYHVTCPECQNTHLWVREWGGSLESWYDK